MNAKNFLSKTAWTVISTTLISSMAFAWGDLGHQTVGEIAQRNLSAKGKKLVHEILGHGPLAEAATFPDLARSDSDYKEFAAFHFVEIDPRYNGDYSKIPAALRAERDADSIISNIPQKLFSESLGIAKYSKNQKQDLMRYLVHLVGDVHQPLHVGTGYDQGGNFCTVKYTEAGKVKTSNLHSYWDSGLVEKLFDVQIEIDPNFKMPVWKGFSELADLIIQDQSKKIDRKKIESTPANEWYKESQSFHSKAYIDSEPTAARDRPYCKRYAKDEQGLVKKDARGVAIILPATTTAEVTHAYQLEASEIIKAQIMKAGLRLAYVINTMAQNEYNDGVKEFQNLKIKELHDLLKDFENPK